MRRNRLVGMLIPDGTNEFFSTIALAYQRYLAQRNCALIVMNADGSVARELAYIEMLAGMTVDGLIFISVGDNLEAFDKLRGFQRPVLVLDREIPLENSDFVLVDDALGVDLAVEHLISLGHRRIALIRGSLNTAPGRARHEAFCQRMAANGLEVDDDLVFPGDFMFGTGAKAVDRLLSIPRDEWPTAVFACNDQMALGALQRLQREGLRVPQDMSLIGYDDVKLCSWVYPMLTTVRQDVLEIAEVGTMLLMDRIDAIELEPTRSAPPRVRTISPKLVKRDSTSPIA